MNNLLVLSITAVGTTFGISGCLIIWLVVDQDILATEWTRYSSERDRHKRKPIVQGRRKRFDYEDTYEWEDDDDLTYESYYQEEEAEPNLFQKIALHWRSAGPRVVCLGALVILIILICCSCLRLACRFWCKSLQENCACCCLPGVKQTCQMCYTDPMYEKVKDLGEAMGIEITFNTYERIKENYTPDTGFDPMEMPLLM